MHLLQVCNVGDICGGTAACAWTVARALPNWRHSVWFLSPATPETQAAFRGVDVLSGQRIHQRHLVALDADLIVWHNVAPDRAVGSMSTPGIQYQHSGGRRRTAQEHVYCSRWLAEQCGQPAGRILYQPVPIPPRPDSGETRRLRDRPLVGRICTPRAHKWPRDLVPFYEGLADEFPGIDWEFIGCPPPLQVPLRAACDGRARFFPAGWMARQALWRWDALLYRQPGCVESFGRVCAEALRAGCVPIVDDLGGFREQIVPGTGFLCGDEAAFREALKALSDPGQRCELSQRAQEYGHERFSLLRFQREFRQLALDVLQ